MIREELRCLVRFQSPTVLYSNCDLNVKALKEKSNKKESALSWIVCSSQEYPASLSLSLVFHSIYSINLTGID